jgi:YD repeat-containing protein
MKRNKAKNFFNLAISLILFLSLIFFIPESHAVMYIYDDLNRLSAAIYDDGKALRYEYDVNGNLVSTKLAEDERLHKIILALRLLTGINEGYTTLDVNKDNKVGLDDVIFMLQEISRR